MDDSEKVEYLHTLFPSWVRRPGRVGVADSHGHLWYCFHPNCVAATGFKGHRSIHTHGGMIKHINAKHDDLTCELNKRMKRVWEDNHGDEDDHDE